jgi:hypothetical protein
MSTPMIVSTTSSSTSVNPRRKSWRDTAPPPRPVTGPSAGESETRSPTRSIIPAGPRVSIRFFAHQRDGRTQANREKAWGCLVLPCGLKDAVFRQKSDPRYRLQATRSYMVHPYRYARDPLPAPCSCRMRPPRRPRAANANAQHHGNNWQPGATKLTSVFCRSHCRKQAYAQIPMQPVAGPT